jgi:hypothetical protein
MSSQRCSLFHERHQCVAWTELARQAYEEMEDHDSSSSSSSSNSSISSGSSMDMSDDVDDEWSNDDNISNGILRSVLHLTRPAQLQTNLTNQLNIKASSGVKNMD